jgi:hypothetical protein
MTDKPASPFQPILDIALDAIGDLASGLADEPGKKSAKADPLARLVTGFASSQGGGFTGLFDQFVPKPPNSHSEPATPASTWSSATDDVRSPDASPVARPADRTQPGTYRSTRAPRPAHSSGVHVGPDATGGLKVVSLPNRCANVDCPNKDHEGHFVMVETEAKVVSNGVRAIRLWMCHPCATGLISTMPDSKGA